MWRFSVVTTIIFLMEKLRFLLLCFCTSNAISQQFVVANMKENIVYCGVDNPLSALVAGYPCSSVVLTVDNGTITKTGCGSFNYRPMNGGEIKIKVWVKNGQQLKKVGEMPYRAKRLPPPIPMIGTYTSGNIPLKIFIALGGIRAVLLNSDFQADFSIRSYTITGMRDKQLFFKTENIGAQYNADALQYFKNLQADDQILISNIICIGPDEKDWKLSPLEFTIIE